jgi:outer membrane autotransporter protein
MAAGGVLNNSGTISATVSQVANIATAYSLHVLASPGGTINNQGGGVLKGNITVVGSAAVNNAGTIEIPDGVTTANIAGNYTQQAGGKLRIGASSATSFAKLTVGGTANLTGSGVIDVNVAASNTLASGDTLTGVLNPGRGAGTVTGTVTATDNSLWLDFTPSIVGARVDLNVVRAPSVVLKSVQATGFTPGTGAATVFDKLITGGTTGDMSTVITALKTLNTQQQISNAVAQTLPLMTGGSQLASLDITRGISHELEAQLAGMQGMASGDSFLGSGELWIKPFGGKARQGDRTGASGFDANTFGLMVGMDKDVSHTTSLGMAFGWARSNLNSNNNLHSANVNAFNLAISGIYHMDADTFLRFVANGGINTNDGQRTIRFGTLNRIAKSNYNSQTAHVGIESGHSFAMGEHLSLTPSLRADYAVIHDNKYTETGAGALNLIVGSNNTDELLLGGDMKLGYTLTDTTIFTVNVGAAYDALQNQTLITSSFAGATGSSFTTAGINPPRWLGRGGANLNFKAGNNINVIAAYDGEVRKSFFNQTGSIKLVMTF